MNTLQILANQVLGVFVFLLLSRYLDKDSYGQLNWALAVLTTITTILSLRLDQVIVRDVAAGKDAGSLLTIFLFHTLAGALLLLLALFILRVPPLLWMLSFSQLLLFVALPFRQIVTGLGNFGWLAMIALVSNVLRATGLVVLVLLPAFTITAVIWVFTVSALAEWILGLGIVVFRLKIGLRRDLRDYTRLLKDSLPQIGSVFLNAGMARVDWILMGIFCSSAATAEYSFAYRAYELSPFPLLVIAPFVLNGFAKRGGERPEWLGKLIRIELLCGTVLPLIGILLWKPVVGALTLQKYGETNFLPFVLLSCSIPFQYLINIYWSADMAANRLGRIFRITAITAGIVIVGDLLLIPFYGGVGAAAVWLAAMTVQYILYAKDARTWILSRIGPIDWALLLFLVGVLNVKLYVKIAAIVVALFWHRRKPIVINRRYLWFYIAMPVLALINLFFSGYRTMDGFFAFGLGSGYWILALLAAWCIYCFVQETDKEQLHQTVRLFFILNSACILISFLVVCIKAGTINPYTFEGEHRKYYIMTGDLMRGIGVDGSVAAAMIGAMGFLYFLYRRLLVETFFCLVTVLLCGSNTVAIMLIVISVGMIIFHSDRLQKSMVVLSFLLAAVFWAKVSPQNGQYVQEILKRVDKRNVYIPPVPIPNAKDFEFVESKAVAQKEAAMISFEKTLYPGHAEDSFKLKYKNYNRSGRLISWEEMVQFFEVHPELMAFGAGMGHFSSKLAFKTTALDIAGSYPEARRFIHPFFRDNYLYLYVFYHSRDEGQHSVVNKPDSVYGQVLTEYGLIGFVLFAILYGVFFAKGALKLSFGLPILLLMGMAFFTEYWFEQLSVVIVFELLLLLDKKLT